MKELICRWFGHKWVDVLQRSDGDPQDCDLVYGLCYRCDAEREYKLTARTAKEFGKSSYPIQTCPKCGGSGRNEDATTKMREREPSLSGHVRCSLCNGNGKY